MKYFVSELKDNMFECASGTLIERKHISYTYIEKYVDNNELVSCITNDKLAKAIQDKYNIHIDSVDKTPYVVLSEDNDIVLVKARGLAENISELDVEALSTADFMFVIYKAEKRLPAPEETKGFFRRKKSKTA